MKAIRGVVVSGKGGASGKMREMSEAYWQATLGYTPHPGTLNIRVRKQDVRTVRSLPATKMPGLAQKLTTLYIDGIPVHARIPKGIDEHGDYVGLISSLPLRVSLGLRDGDEVELTDTSPQPYQDIWRNGGVVREGKRDCAGRFSAITEALRARTEGLLRICDIGGRDGYFAVRFAEAGHTVTVVDPRITHLPVEITRVPAKFTPASPIGDYDAIICLSVLHHVPNWRETYEAMKRRCTWLIVETPDASEVFKTPRPLAEIQETIRAESDGLLCLTPSMKGIGRETHIIRGYR